VLSFLNARESFDLPTSGAKTPKEIGDGEMTFWDFANYYLVFCVLLLVTAAVCLTVKVVWFYCTGKDDR